MVQEWGGREVGGCVEAGFRRVGRVRIWVVGVGC